MYSQFFYRALVHQLIKVELVNLIRMELIWLTECLQIMPELLPLQSQTEAHQITLDGGKVNFIKRIIGNLH